MKKEYIKNKDLYIDYNKEDKKKQDKVLEQLKKEIEFDKTEAGLKFYKNKLGR